MGIPKFYRWMSERYPLINEKIDGQVSPEFDCLYLDMNGIFHNCSHGMQVKSGLSAKQMYIEIFKYISYIVSLVKPKQLLYMAVDGVAPRAKQNQQRQRRFVSAKDAKLALETMKKTGRAVSTTSFDSNVITPGTEWMENLSSEMELYIRKQMSENMVWKKLTVIYSNHLVPGEGEHKIMEYIRGMKMQQGYNPNTRHCMYGLDADLIILSLVSHEPHFALLREEVIFGLEKQERHIKENQKILRRKNVFQLFHISILRKYIDLEFSSLKKELKFEYNLERIIDDFVFLCMFVGCDFLPHMPTIDIATGGMQILFDSYRKILPTLDNYLLIHNDSVQKNINLKENKSKHTKQINIKNMKLLFKELGAAETFSLKEQYLNLQKYYGRVNKDRERRYGSQDNKESRSKMKKEIGNLREPSIDDMKSILEMIEKGDSSGFKNKYYSDRWLHNEMASQESRKQLCFDYLVGLQWILDYYYDGCPSWGWYFEHHYSPLVSDMAEIEDDYKIEFDLSEPYLPFEQLLAVLPVASSHCLPPAYRELMDSRKSPLSKFFPEDFEIDMNFATVPWGGIALLPFIDEKVLKRAINTIDDLRVSKDDRNRNRREKAMIIKYDDQLFDMKKRISGPGIKSKIVDAASIEEFVCPEISVNNGYFMTRPCDGYKDEIEGFPQFDVMKFTNYLKKIPCRIFGIPSRYETMVLQLYNKHEEKSNTFDDELFGNSFSILNELNLGNNNDNRSMQYQQGFSKYENYNNYNVSDKDRRKQKQSQSIVRESEMSTDEIREMDSDAKKIMQEECVFVGWPFLRQAKVVRVETERFCYEFKKTVGPNGEEKEALVQYENDIVRSRKWAARCGKLKDENLTMFGIECGAISTLVTVKQLKGLSRKQDKFEIIREWTKEETIYPKCLVFWSGMDKKIGDYSKMVLDSRFPCGNRAINFAKEMSVGTPVMYVGDSEYFGKCGRVTALKDGFVDIRVISQFDETDFAHRIIEKSKKTVFLPIYFASKKANMDKKIFSRISGQIIVKLPMYLGLGTTIDLGLNLKLGKQGLVIPGYTRGTTKIASDGISTYNEIQFSERAIDLIKDYRKKFPSVFAAIACNIYAKTMDLNYFTDSQRIDIPFEEYLGVINNDEYNTKLEKKLAQREESMIAQQLQKRNESKQESSKNRNNNSNNNNNGNGSTFEELMKNFNKEFASLDVNESKAVKSKEDEEDDDIADTGEKSKSKSAMDLESVPTEAGSNDIDSQSDNEIQSSLQVGVNDTVAPSIDGGVNTDNIDDNNNNNNNNSNNNSKEIDNNESKDNKNSKNEETIESMANKNAIDQVFENTRQITLEDLEFKKDVEFRERDEAVSFLFSVKDWISKQRSSELPLVEQDSRVLSDSVIDEIEDGANLYYVRSRSDKPKGYRLCDVPVHHVYAADPEIAWSPTPKSAYKLGDRVASLRTDCGMSFGTLSTVVGIHKTFIEVLTDRDVLGGSSLHNRCSPFRGFIVPHTAIVNLSQPPFDLPKEMFDDDYDDNKYNKYNNDYDNDNYNYNYNNNNNNNSNNNNNGSGNNMNNSNNNDFYHSSSKYGNGGNNNNNNNNNGSYYSNQYGYNNNSNSNRGGKSNYNDNNDDYNRDRSYKQYHRGRGRGGSGRGRRSGRGSRGYRV